MKTPPGSRRNAPLGFIWRLTASLGLVVIAGGVTVLGVALGVAPRIFSSHLQMAPAGTIDPAVRMQVDEAFAIAIVTSLGVAITVAMLTALAVTWVVARRLGRSVASIAEAADRIAQGNLAVRVQAPAIGPEFTQLAEAFNAMAARLALTETTRRRLIGDLAHEMRTPIASLQATMEAVVDGVLPADALTLATLVDQTARLQHLVADMSSVSRAEERPLDLHAQPVDLALLAIQAVAATRAGYTAAGVQLRVAVAGKAPIVRVDPQRMAEAVANLLDNALRHTPVAGEVRVEVGASPGGAVLDVIDSGTGFDPKDAERIFERFYRADSSRTHTSAGSGIGLTIARAIVQAHDGTLTATSDGAGTGATFRIRLPADRRPRRREQSA